jgi:hypothetical protein
MALAGTKLRSWRQRLDAAKRKIAGVKDEIDDKENAELKSRLDEADCYLADCLSILAATIEICRDPRGARPGRTDA